MYEKPMKKMKKKVHTWGKIKKTKKISAHKGATIILIRKRTSPSPFHVNSNVANLKLRD